MAMRKSFTIAFWAVLAILILASPKTAAALPVQQATASSDNNNNNNDSERQLMNVFGTEGGYTNNWRARRYPPMQYMMYNKKNMGYYMMMMKKGYKMMGYMMMKGPVWKPPRPPTPPSPSGVTYRIPFELAISLSSTGLRHLQQQRQPNNVVDTQRIVTTFLTQQLWTTLSLRSLDLDTRSFENRGTAGFRVRFRLQVRVASNQVSEEQVVTAMASLDYQELENLLRQGVTAFANIDNVDFIPLNRPPPATTQTPPAGTTQMPPGTTEPPPSNTQVPPTGTQTPPTGTQFPPSTQTPPTGTPPPPSTQTPPTGTQVPPSTQTPPTGTPPPPSTQTPPTGTQVPPSTQTPPTGTQTPPTTTTDSTTTSSTTRATSLNPACASCTCPTGMQLMGDTCYERCPLGLIGAPGKCHYPCPEGYADFGPACIRNSLDFDFIYKRPSYDEQADCEAVEGLGNCELCGLVGFRDWHPIGCDEGFLLVGCDFCVQMYERAAYDDQATCEATEGVGNCEDCGFGLTYDWHPVCREGYLKGVACEQCRKSLCPPGYTEEYGGLTCIKPPSEDRAVGMKLSCATECVEEASLLSRLGDCLYQAFQTTGDTVDFPAIEEFAKPFVEFEDVGEFLGDIVGLACPFAARELLPQIFISSLTACMAGDITTYVGFQVEATLGALESIVTFAIATDPYGNQACFYQGCLGATLPDTGVAGNIVIGALFDDKLSTFSGLSVSVEVDTNLDIGVGAERTIPDPECAPKWAVEMAFEVGSEGGDYFPINFGVGICGTILETDAPQAECDPA